MTQFSDVVLLSVIGEVGGLARPRSVRQVIESNWDEFLRYGSLPFVMATPENGGPAHKEYWLNEEQALAVLTLLRTPEGNVSARLDDDEKASVQIMDGSQRRQMTIVNRPGLTKVLRDSQKPEAKAAADRFDRWVRHDMPPIS